MMECDLSRLLCLRGLASPAIAGAAAAGGDGGQAAAWRHSWRAVAGRAKVAHQHAGLCQLFVTLFGVTVA
jgi:hypothetical protein